ARDPLEVLARLLAPRHDVHGVLDRDGPEPIEPPKDLRPEVRRRRRNLVDEEQPPRGRRLVVVARHRPESNMATAAGREAAIADVTWMRDSGLEVRRHRARVDELF